MQKLKAFTLMELLIGMIVSAIVIGFCYVSYQMIYKQFVNYKTIKQELVEVMQFHALLNDEFANSKKILFEGNILTVVNAELEEINYNFEEAFVLRKSREVVDTFLLKTLNVSADDKITETDFLEPVILFSFDALVLKELEHFQFSKVYDADIMVNVDFENFQK